MGFFISIYMKLLNIKYIFTYYEMEYTKNMAVENNNYRIGLLVIANAERFDGKVNKIP